jgi:hypothetical protein
MKNVLIDPAVERVIISTIADLVDYADKHGVNFEVTREPLEPLATGNHMPVIRVWPKREFTRPE